MGLFAKGLKSGYVYSTQLKQVVSFPGILG
jgi:hypothetical protein